MFIIYFQLFQIEIYFWPLRFLPSMPPFHWGLCHLQMDCTQPDFRHRGGGNPSLQVLKFLFAKGVRVGICQ